MPLFRPRPPRPKAFLLTLLLPLLLIASVGAAAFHAGAPLRAVPPGAAPGAGPIPGTKTGNELSLFSDQLKISISPVPFSHLEPGDFIVREIKVRNDLPAPVDIRIVLKFSSDFRARSEEEADKRVVSTERKVPAHSNQAFQLFIPTGFPLTFEIPELSIMDIDSSVFVNGEEFMFSNMMKTDVSSELLPLPPSFGKEENTALFLRSALSGHDYSPLFWHKDRQWSEFEVQKTFKADIATSDTVQWPSIPQAYQSKSIIFRKTGDVFSEDAERAIQDAVMLGSTELLLVTSDDTWPEWSKTRKPDSHKQPVIVPRGLGQSVLVFADAVQIPETGTGPVAAASGPADAKEQESEPEEDVSRTISDDDTDPGTVNWEERFDIPPMTPDPDPAGIGDKLTRANIWTVDPAQLFMMLPHIKTPSVPFRLIQLALLAYIIIVGPVNYFIFVRKKKKNVLILLLTVPIISIVFVALVFLAMGIVEGWQTRASAVGVTFLDQQGKMAYTRAGVQMYASFPVREMKFDPADSVTFSNTKKIDIRLGSEQVISGPNQARIPLSYTISRAERHLEQLRVTRNADGGISVMNGLGVPLSNLIVKLEDGGIWTAGSVVQPGESVALARFAGALPSMETICAELASELSAKRPGDVKLPFNDLLLTASALLFEAPEDISAEDLNELLPESVYGDLRSVNPLALLAMKKELGKPDVVKAVLPPGLYMAETDRPAFYTPGCKPSSFRVRHIVFGNFTVQEAKSNEN